MLFHTELNMPDQIKQRIRTTGQCVLKYSRHAQHRADQRGIELPRIIDYAKCHPFEVEAKRDGTIIKVAYRVNYPDDTKSDLILIIQPSDNFVRTIWLNLVEDQHVTLNVTKYQSQLVDQGI